MNVNRGKTEFTDAEHAALRIEVRKVIDSDGVAQADIARQTDIPGATLSQYLNDRYSAEPGKAGCATKLNKWLAARIAAAEARNTLPVWPGYVTLNGSRSIRSILDYALHTGSLVMAAGAPGVSKTVTARQYREDMPRAYYAVMDSTTSGVPTMLLEVLQSLGVTDAKGTPLALKRMVSQRLGEAQSLLIIDESQHLTVKAIEVLRAICDHGDGSIGIAMLGNEAAWSAVGATGVKAEFAQVSSRFAHRSWIVAPDPVDAATLAKAWAAANGEEVTEREVRFCQEIAAKPGGLRNIRQTFVKALLIARGKQETFGVAHLQSAFAQLSGLVRAA